MTNFFPQSGYDYTSYLAFSVFTYFLILSLGFAFLSALSDFLSYREPPKLLKCCERKALPNPISMPSVVESGATSEVGDFFVRHDSSPVQRVRRRRYRNLFCKDASGCLGWTGWIFFVLSFMSFGAFSLIPDFCVILVGLVLLGLKFWNEIKAKSHIYSLDREFNRSTGFSTLSWKRRAYILQDAYNNNPVQISIQIFVIIFISIFLPLLFSQTCLCFYNSGWGITFNLEHYNFSTKFTRALELAKVCPYDEICHTYITLPEDSTFAFLNIHTGLNIQKIYVFYTPETQFSEKTYQYQTLTKYFQPKNIELKGERLVHTAVLSDLEPGSIYRILIRFGEKNNEKVFFYKCPPNDKIRFALGGDVGNTNRARKISETIGKVHKPDVIFIGGDIAYDNDSRACFYTYDLILKQIETIYRDMGYMIPIILAVGNHDVGFDAGTGRLTRMDSSSSFYFLYFPQNSGMILGTVTEIKERRTNHFHVIGNVIFFALDSGYIKTYESQITWIEQNSNKFFDKLKFSGYHVPIYTPCTQSYEAEFRGMTFWVPIFDKYKFQASFENHQHILTKTYPLRDNMHDENGTYYLGQGAWGADMFPNCTGPYPDLSKFFEEAKNVGHIWIMDIDQEEKLITYSAYDEESNVLIPKFKQNFYI